MKTILKGISEYFRKMDKLLLFAVTLCAGFSVVLLYSIYVNQISSSVGASYYQTQLIAMAIGFASCLLLSAIDYQKLAKLWFLYAPVALALVILTFTSLGFGRDGADDRAWLKIGSFSLQPSEILKLAFLLTFSLHLSKVRETMNKPINILLLAIHAGIPALLIVKQGDHGTALVFITMTLAMLFIAGISIWYILLGIIVAIPAGIFTWYYILKPVHKNRILILFHPGSDPQGIELQQNRGKIALGSGQLFGKGLFSDDFTNVPEVHNDFILSYIGEAFGFVGAIAVVLLLTFICLKILFDSRLAKDDLGKMICTGAFAMIFTHCFMNIGMVLGVMPVIGIPLPFLSAGGTAMMSMYIAIGLVMSVYSHREVKYRMFSSK